MTCLPCGSGGAAPKPGLLVSYLTLGLLHLENERVCPQERLGKACTHGLGPYQSCEERWGQDRANQAAAEPTGNPASRAH